MSFLSDFFNFLKGYTPPKNVDINSLPILKYGSSGSHVKTLHERLIASGARIGILEDEKNASIFKDRTKTAVIYFQQTHLGPDKKPLSVDGIVGPDSWWALFNNTGEAQKQNLIKESVKQNISLIPNGISENRRKVLEVAVAEYKKGVKEIPDGSNWGYMVKPYLQYCGLGPAPWCCAWVCWIFGRALIKLPWEQKIAHVQTLYKHCKKFGFSKSISSGYKPQPGDIFIIEHSGGSTGHTGILLRISDDYKKLNVLEGNSGDRLSLRTRIVGQNDHIGYINPFVEKDNSDNFEKGIIENADVGDLNKTR